MYNKEDLLKKIQHAINSTKTMASAAKLTGVNYKTFRRIAKEAGFFHPNQGGKGIYTKSLEQVFSGDKCMTFPQLRKRLIDDAILPYKCNCCGIDSWNGSMIVLELDHIDGNKTNNSLLNLRFLCPNCHSQTPTYRNKNVKIITYKNIREAFAQALNFNQLCILLGCSNRKIHEMKWLTSRLEAMSLKFTVAEKSVLQQISIKEIAHAFPVKKGGRKAIHNKSRSRKNKECGCGKIIYSNSKTCYNCMHLRQRKVDRPSYASLKAELSFSSYCAVGRKYGVSDNSVRNWVKTYEKQNNKT